MSAEAVQGCGESPLPSKKIFEQENDMIKSVSGALGSSVG